MYLYFNDKGLITDEVFLEKGYVITPQSDTYCYKTLYKNWVMWRGGKWFAVDEPKVPKKYRLLLLLHKE